MGCECECEWEDETETFFNDKDETDALDEGGWVEVFADGCVNGFAGLVPFAISVDGAARAIVILCVGDRISFRPLVDVAIDDGVDVDGLLIVMVVDLVVVVVVGFGFAFSIRVDTPLPPTRLIL